MIVSYCVSGRGFGPIRAHLQGFVSLEVYGHLGTQTFRPDKLFHEELTQLLRSLALADASRATA
jgi:hypothetical protein